MFLSSFRTVITTLRSTAGRAYPPLLMFWEGVGEVRSGSHVPISIILDAVFQRRERIQRALDVGVGFGKYGLLRREYLELWDGREKFRPEDWLRRIDGIEIKANYILSHHRNINSQIYIGEALEIIQKFPSGSYDLVLIADVLEHFKKAKGFELLREALRIST